nr:MAG TPA: hypothetical protein [Caudoviricetes sp.]
MRGAFPYLSPRRRKCVLRRFSVSSVILRSVHKNRARRKFTPLQAIVAIFPPAHIWGSAYITKLLYKYSKISI